MSKGLYWTSTTVGALFLSMYWLKLFLYLESDNPFGHKNYWGADVGTYLLMALLVVLTPAYLYAICKNFPNGKTRK